MSTFEKSIGLILQHEGGYTNNPADGGKNTNYGISLRFLEEMPLTVGDFDHDGDIDGDDIRNMNVEDAKKIYKLYWWDKFKYGSINDQTIATKVLDFSINMGASRGHKLLQTAMNKTFGLKLSTDGVIGPTSLMTINAIGDGDEEQLLIKAYCDEAYAFYQSLIVAKPSLKVFEKGWKNRAYSINVANSVK